eukprot:scaffold253034_cov18-Tisochrysis_lutea.AAC.2
MLDNSTHPPIVNHTMYGCMHVSLGLAYLFKRSGKKGALSSNFFFGMLPRSSSGQACRDLQPVPYCFSVGMDDASLTLNTDPCPCVCPVQAMDDASLKKSEIDEIVLVGGSTRIPKVRELSTDLSLQVQPGALSHVLCTALDSCSCQYAYAAFP